MQCSKITLWQLEAIFSRWCSLCHKPLVGRKELLCYKIHESLHDLNVIASTLVKVCVSYTPAFPPRAFNADNPALADASLPDPFTAGRLKSFLLFSIASLSCSFSIVAFSDSFSLWRDLISLLSVEGSTWNSSDGLSPDRIVRRADKDRLWSLAVSEVFDCCWTSLVLTIDFEEVPRLPV